jgi:hypothetical protein
MKITIVTLVGYAFYKIWVIFHKIIWADAFSKWSDSSTTEKILLVVFQKYCQVVLANEPG